MKNSYFGIGCYHMKYGVNYGTLFRSALILGADFIFLIGKRFKKMSSDTTKTFKTIPLYEYETFEQFKKNLPYGCQIIAIELDNNSESIEYFKHPLNCVYLLGAEDHGIPQKELAQCHKIVNLPGEQSMNVAIAGSIAMYDRILKEGRQ